MWGRFFFIQEKLFLVGLLLGGRLLLLGGDGGLDDVLGLLGRILLALAGSGSGSGLLIERTDGADGGLHKLQTHAVLARLDDDGAVRHGNDTAIHAADAANILKPALSRGEIRVVGATTLDEYRKYIEKDAALERRFQPVTVGEPSPEATLEILKGLRDKYEAHHKLTITDEALEAAVSLSRRYINDRFLPDKAIDLMDEAASQVRMSAESTSPDLKSLEEKINALHREKADAIAAQDYEKAAQLRDLEQK